MRNEQVANSSLRLTFLKSWAGGFLQLASFCVDCGLGTRDFHHVFKSVGPVIPSRKCGTCDFVVFLWSLRLVLTFMVTSSPKQSNIATAWSYPEHSSGNPRDWRNHAFFKFCATRGEHFQVAVSSDEPSKSFSFSTNFMQSSLLFVSTCDLLLLRFL